MGILIAIDGVDASGKQTQTELLKKRLENNELKIKSVSFPAYDNPSSTLVTDLRRIKPIGERITKTVH